MNTDIRFEDGKLYVTRIYEAPRDAVFEAWVETSKVQQWWGCDQTTAVCSEIEPKVGGKYNHVMTLKGEGEFPANARFIEYDPPKRLVYASEATEISPAMTVSVDFLEHAQGTVVRLVHEGLPSEFVQYVKPGWAAAFRKLEAFLTAAV